MAKAVPLSNHTRLHTQVYLVYNSYSSCLGKYNYLFQAVLGLILCIARVLGFFTISSSAEGRIFRLRLTGD